MGKTICKRHVGLFSPLHPLYKHTDYHLSFSLSRSFIIFFFEHKWCLHLCCVSVAALMISCHILHYNLLILLGNIIQPQSETCLKRPQNYWSNSSSSTSHLLFFLFFFFFILQQSCASVTSKNKTQCYTINDTGSSDCWCKNWPDYNPAICAAIRAGWQFAELSRYRLATPSRSFLCAPVCNYSG